MSAAHALLELGWATCRPIVDRGKCLASLEGTITAVPFVSGRQCVDKGEADAQMLVFRNIHAHGYSCRRSYE